MTMVGNIHGVETMGGVDGPGIRAVVFMQGCRLRCVYCHNPETWSISGGEAVPVDDLFQKLMRFKPYFGHSGGVTVSGGEPLLQPLFVAELFKRLKQAGISTALDTAGVAVTDEVIEVLKLTDIVLIDLKATSESQYFSLTGGSLETTLSFLKTAAAMGCRIWIRHVVVPGINDTTEDIEKLYRLIQETGICIEKIELLGYHRLGIQKYRKMNLSYKLPNTPSLAPERLNVLENFLEDMLNKGILYIRQQE